MKSLSKMMYLLPKKAKETVGKSNNDSTPKKKGRPRDSYGFGPLQIKLTNNDSVQVLNRLTKSLQWSTSNHCAVITIAESKSTKHYDYRGYDIATTEGSDAAAEKQRALLYAALGRMDFTELVVQDVINPKNGSQRIHAPVRLSDLTVCLKGGWDTLECLTLSGLVLIANRDEAEDFAKTLRGMAKLRSLTVKRCCLMMVGPQAKEVDGWDPILRACSVLPTLETLHITKDPDTYISPSLLSALQSEADGQNHLLVEGVLSEDYLETLLRLSNRLQGLTDLTLSLVWNETNQKFLSNFVDGHCRLETLKLELRSSKTTLHLQSFLQALTVNSSLKEIHLCTNHTLQLQAHDDIWKRLRERNKTLQGLFIMPECLPPLIHATNDAWLEMNRTSYFSSRRLDDDSALAWTSILSHPWVTEDTDLLYGLLMKIHPLLIQP